tara:strand:- start:458 stop:1090 length:633 start_codon:yes stop_codon:yes gene_type:complete
MVRAHNQRRSKQQANNMASSITELNERMAQVRATHPDGRTRQHKQAVKHVYESTIAHLTERLSAETQRNKQLRSRVALANSDQEATPLCSICMEDMYGRVTLECGHEMCPNCFAQHSRVNNTCPFCREEFAPKPKIQSKIPLYAIDAIAEAWADTVSINSPTHRNYFKRQLQVNRSKNDIEAEQHIRWLITANGKILMEKVKNWYDKDIP